MIQGHLIAHWLVVLYFYGWAHYAIDYVKKVHGVNELDFIHEWAQYFIDKVDIVGQEHRATQKSLIDVFENDALWGRQITNSDSIFWEFKSATSVVIHQHRSEFANSLATFLFDVYGIENKDLVKLNMDMCVNWEQEYPCNKSYHLSVLKTLFGIEQNEVVIDHWDRECDNDLLFIRKAYHWQRKNRYWRCSIIPEK
jgi:hypothetical protein